MKIAAKDTLVKLSVLGTAGALLALVAYFLNSGQTNGSKTIVAFATVLAILPLCTYAALKRPLLFPFCLYVILVPFDQLLGFSKLGTITRLLAVVSGAAIIFWIVRNRQVNRPPKSLGVWCLVLLWMAMTMFWAIDPLLALNRVVVFSQLLGLYAALCLFEIELRDLKAIVVASVLGGIAAAAYGAYYFHNNLSTVMKRLILSNSEGDIIDPNHFAAGLILPITAVTVAVLTVRSFWLKLLLILVDLILFTGVYESGSRGSVVAVGVVFAYLFFVMRSRWQIAAVAAAVVVISFFLPSVIWDRFSVAVSSGGAGRTAIWHVGYEAFKKFWLTGAGVGNFPLAYDTAYLKVFSHYQHWSRGSHNLVMATGVELGAIGLLIMALAWGVHFTILNKISRSSGLFNFRVISQGALIGLLTAAMFLDVLYTKYAWLTFAVAALTYSAWRAESVYSAQQDTITFQRELQLSRVPPTAEQTLH